jgi:sensor domain CHASE-containing protein
MSQHICTARDSAGNNVQVILGYDRPLNFVFCTITDSEGEIVYCNLSDPAAGTRQQDVNYYRPILEKAGVKLPEAMFEQVAEDQALRVGNRVVSARPITKQDYRAGLRGPDSTTPRGAGQ